MEPTAKQIAYIASLKAEMAAKLEDANRGVVIAMSDRVWAALTVALPVPATMDEASEQIEAITGGMHAYSRAHREWAEPIVHEVSSAR